MSNPDEDLTGAREARRAVQDAESSVQAAHAADRLAGSFDALDSHLSAGGNPPAGWDRLSVWPPTRGDLARAVEQAGIYQRPAVSSDALAGLILTALAGGEG